MAREDAPQLRPAIGVSYETAFTLGGLAASTSRFFWSVLISGCAEDARPDTKNESPAFHQAG